MTSPRSRHRSLSGFTLVELMIVVVILGILAAIAIPAFTRYVRKSKTAEATTNIAHLVTGEVTAYQRFADNETAHFIQAMPTPTEMPTESKYPANPSLWTGDPNWAQLGFSLDSGHYYQYSTNVSGGLLLMPNLLLRSLEDVSSGPASGFSVAATGNLDGDEEYSEFSRTGTLVDGEIQLDRLSITSELE